MIIKMSNLKTPKKINDYLLLVLCFLYTLISGVNLTEFKYQAFDLSNAVTVVIALIVICLFINIVMNKFYVSMLLFAIIAVTLILFSNYDGMNNYLFLILVAVGFANEDIRPFVKAILVAQIILYIFTISMTLIGVYPNRISISPRGVVRYGYGFLSLRALAANYFSIITMIVFLKYNKIKKWLFIALCIPILPVFFLNDARTAMLLSFSLLFLVFVSQKNDDSLRFTKKLYFLCNAAYLGGAAFTILGSWFYQSKGFLYIIDKVLGRLEWGHWFLTNYPPRLFGQQLPLNLEIVTLQRDYSLNYLMLDSGYMTMLLEAGVLVFIITSVIILLSFRKFYKQQNNMMLIIWFLIAIDLIQNRNLHAITPHVLALSQVFSLANKKAIGIKM